MGIRRSVLKRLVDQLIGEAESKSYDHWLAQDFPIAYETVFEGEAVQVEMNLLESKLDYLHVAISADDGGFSAWVPVHRDTIIRRVDGLTTGD